MKAPHSPRADVRPAISPEEMIDYLRGHQITLTWDQAAGTLRAGTGEAARTLIRKAS